MATKLKQGSFYASDEELERLRRKAKGQRLTFSNLVREALGLARLKRGTGARPSARRRRPEEVERDYDVNYDFGA